MTTAAQIRALKFARDYWPLRIGTIEQSDRIKLSGAALDAVITSLERRGLVDADGRITDAGRLLIGERAASSASAAPAIVCRVAG